MKYFEGYKFKSIAAVFAKLIEAVFELVLPILMARLIDEGIRGQDMNIVYRMVIWMFVLTIFGYIASLTCQYLASHVSQRIGGRLRSALFRKINTFSASEYDSYSSALLTNRITTDVNLIQDMIARTIRLGVRAPILMVGSLFALYSINPKLAQTLFLTFPVFVVVVIAFMYFSMQGHKRASKTLDTLVSKVQESLSGTRIIRAFSKQKEDDDNFKGINTELSNKQTKVGWITTLSSPFTSLLMNLVLVLLVYLGAFEINSGNMTQGQTMAVINYCTQLVLTLIVAMNLVMIFSRGYTSSLRVKEIMQTEVTVKNEGTRLVEKPVTLSFDNVTYHYPGQSHPIIEDVSFTVEPGKVLGIIGLTGSGKSTLVKLIPRLMDVSSGSIRLNGSDIREFELNNVRDTVGYVSQSAQFMRATMEENVLMVNGVDAKTRIEHAQGKDILNKGIDTLIETGGTNLSGGQRQRLSIARALAKDPQVLIFDDSFSALDFLTDKNLREGLKKNYGHVSQIVISQRSTSVMDADEIIVLDKGSISARGRHEDLMKTSEIYQQIHRIQTEGGKANA